jgi:UDP-glucose 4-epimerase
VAARNILVTGGFGFIGSHLVEAIISDPHHHVHVVDNLSTSPIDLDAYRDHLGRPGNLTYDICSVEQYCKELAGRQSFNQIYHLASVVGPVGVLSHAGKLAQHIINDTCHIIDLALRFNAKIVDVSTSEVYGGGRDGYCAERDFKIVQPKVTVRLEYAIGKLAAEIALINTTRVAPLAASIVRPFNVAGPRQSGEGGFVLPRFLSQVLAGKPLTVYGDGKMIRAFTHVKDIVQGILLVMEKGVSGEVYNIGNPANKTSILDLAKRVICLTQKTSELSFVDPKSLFGPLFEEANDKYPDADRAMRELSWRPIYSLDDTILDTFEYIKSRRRD